MTSGATLRYFAITKETGKDIAIAATFIMKFVIIKTNVAILITNTSQWDF